MVMPNRDRSGDKEGFGMTFLEASAAGKPVIAGMSGGASEAVSDGVTGSDYRSDRSRPTGSSHPHSSGAAWDGGSDGGGRPAAGSHPV